MNVPMPPTDNLYKFAALSGTVIIILSIYLPADYASKLDDKNAAISLKLATLKAEVEDFKKRSKKLTDIAENTIKAKKKGLDNTKLILFYTQDELKKMHHEKDELARSMNLKLVELDEYDKNRIKVNKQLKINRILVGVGSFVGCLLATLGYSLWYHRIQKYQDIAIKNEALRKYEGEGGGGLSL